MGERVRTGAALQPAIVALAGQEALHLLHVRPPVNLGVGDAAYDERAQRQLADHQRGSHGGGGDGVLPVQQPAQHPEQPRVASVDGGEAAGRHDAGG